MLKHYDDRLDYGQILSPPIDYTLDAAVGTTYSLDLETLVGACIAMGVAGAPDSEIMKNPVCLLEALRLTCDKVSIFCEAGQILFPRKINSLFVLLEKMVFPVKTEKRKGKYYPSFHPKFWILRFKNNDNQIIYRIIILSRNLTFDRSWDISFCMQGEIINEISHKNESISEFLRYLHKNIPNNDYGKYKTRIIRSIIRDLPYVNFITDEKYFNDFQFIHSGIKSTYELREHLLIDKSYDEVLLISPFLSSSVINNYNAKYRKQDNKHSTHILITREMSLAKLKKEDVSNFQIYTLKHKIIDGESTISENTESVSKQDIHAKMYMFRKKSDVYLYLGSANASVNAFQSNIELMILLHSKNRYVNLDKLKLDLFGNDENSNDNPFQPITLDDIVEDDSEDTRKLLENKIKEISRIAQYAEVNKENDLYSLTVHFGNIQINDYTVTISPLMAENRFQPLDTEITYSGLLLTQLSEFYIIKVSNNEEDSIQRVLIIPTKSLPYERDKAIISNVVKKEGFYNYIAFILGNYVNFHSMSRNSINGTQRSGRKFQTKPALYEKLLQAAATSPEKFEGIEFMMNAISEYGIVPDDFKKLYETFKRVIK